jgi:molybdopterin converting factor small subunit
MLILIGEVYMAKVKYSGELRSIIGKSEEELEVSNVRKLLDIIRERYGETAYVKAKSSLISVDGYKIKSLRGKDGDLNTHSVVCFFPICAGG